MQRIKMCALKCCATWALAKFHCKLYYLYQTVQPCKQYSMTPNTCRFTHMPYACMRHLPAETMHVLHMHTQSIYKHKLLMCSVYSHEVLPSRISAGTLCACMEKNKDNGKDDIEKLEIVPNWAQVSLAIFSRRSRGRGGGGGGGRMQGASVYRVCPRLTWRAGQGTWHGALGYGSTS